MTLHEATLQLVYRLMAYYDAAEARNIADLVMEHLTGWTRIDRVLHKTLPLSLPQQQELEAMTGRLVRPEPVQYVLGEAWFAGRRFRVNEGVLIPRPETEELVAWAGKDLSAAGGHPRVLDIGTGSGCIAVTLKLGCPAAEVWACDISTAALETAAGNAGSLGAAIRLEAVNFLEKTTWDTLPFFDVLVSNPPYIPLTERESLPPHVRDFEPPLALFVPEADPLVFYRAIARFATEHLNPGGRIYLEIHEQLGEAVLHLLRESGFRPELRKDMQGKDRMIRAVRESDG
ncbi:MAG TPA: peptide chain release factor N(5)-glutamine methyltransferase [Chitinophagaceae bacterium]|nr:peptide chain release factor N(5)-glutamine methyltransferase [Chitinophagaceae bacterium]